MILNNKWLLNYMLLWIVIMVMLLEQKPEKHHQMGDGWPVGPTVCPKVMAACKACRIEIPGGGSNAVS